jgi:hypothetical protein
VLVATGGIAAACYGRGMACVASARRPPEEPIESVKEDLDVVKRGLTGVA